MSDLTIDYYNSNTQNFIDGTIDADVAYLRDRFLRHVPLGGSILDLGCGSGRDTKAFFEMGYAVEAIDGSQELCKKATELTGCHVECKDFFEIDDEEKYDGIWACASILHVEKKRIPDLLFRLSRALRKGGVLYVSFKYGDFSGERDGRYFVDLDEEEFRKIHIHSIEKYGCKLKIIDEWKSEDVRRGKPVKWLNEILRKE